MTITGHKALDENGFEVFPLLTPEEAIELKEYYLKNSTRNSDYNPTYAEFTVLSTPMEVRDPIFNFLSGKLMPKVDKILPGYKPVLTNFVVKEPGGGSVPLHQNWAVVDEKKYSSYSVWIPLVNANKSNGTLGFIPKSHLKFRGARGGYANMPFSQIEPELLEKYVEFVDVKMGDAIILDDSVLHYSSVNNASEPRIAIQMMIAPQSADIVYYDYSKYEGGNLVQKYIVDSSFYMHLKNWTGDTSKYKMTNKFRLKSPVYTLESFLNKMNSAEPVKGFWKKISYMFNKEV